MRGIRRTYGVRLTAMAASAMLLVTGVGLTGAPGALATTPSPTITSYATFAGGTQTTNSYYQPEESFYDGTDTWIANAIWDNTLGRNSQLAKMDSSGTITATLEVTAPPGCLTTSGQRCANSSRINGVIADANYVWFGTMWGYVGKVAKSGFSSSSTVTWVDTGGTVGSDVVLGFGAAPGSIWYTDSVNRVGLIGSNDIWTDTSAVSKCPSGASLAARGFVTLNFKVYVISGTCDSIIELQTASGSSPALGAPVNTWRLSAVVPGSATPANLVVNNGTMTVAPKPGTNTNVLWFSAGAAVSRSYVGFVGWLDPSTPTTPAPTATAYPLGASGVSITAYGLVMGSDGNLWTVADRDTTGAGDYLGEIYRVTPEGAVTAFTSQANFSTSIGAAATGPSGETILWYNSRGMAFSAVQVWGIRKFVLAATYTVSYNANTGSGTAPTASDFAPPATVTVASQGSLTKAGNSFTGWNTLANGTGTAYSAGSTYSAAANVTLYAQWAASNTLTYDANGGQGTPPSAASVATGGSLTVLGNTTSMTKSGSTFGGWNTLANGTGTAYAAGASITMNADATLFAVWTPVPPAPPTPSNPTGDTPTSSPSPSPTPSTPTSPTDPPLSPVVNSVTKSLPPGKGAVTQNGTVVNVTVAPNSSKNGIEFDGDNWRLSLSGTLPGGSAAPLNSRGQMEIVQGRGLRTTGVGFAPNTMAQIYLLPPNDTRSGSSRTNQPGRVSTVIPLTAPLLLGSVPIGGDGTFVGTLPVPLTVPPGDYVSQVVAYSPTMQVRTASLGVVLTADKKLAVKRVTTTVYFASGSSKLDSKAKAALSAAANKIPKSAAKVNVQSIGYVQGTSYTGNDISLSTARAENVAAQLKRDGISGRYFVSGRGVAKERGSTARRVEVVIAYTTSK